MSLGNSSIHQRGDIPEIVKLPNDRIRVIRRFQKFTREDVDNANLGSLMGNFGSLDSTDEQIIGQGYTDCRLISVEVDTRFNSQANADNAVLVKTYETLTDAFVEITDPTISTEENGLKKITKVYRAISGTTSSNTVGTTTLPTTGEILASSEIQDNTAFAELTEIYVESGILSETLDNVGSQEAKVIETIGSDPATPSGYSLASKQESNFEGLQTNRFTFLKPSILSLKQELSGGSKQVSVQAFGLDVADVISALSEVTADHVLLSKSESDYAGIKTTTFEFRLDESFTEDYELNGLQRISLVELGISNFTAQTIGSVSSSAPTTGLYLGTQKIDNGGAIKTRESVWLESGQISKLEVQGPDGLPDTKTVTYVSQITEPTSSGILLSKNIDNTGGYKIYTYKYLEGQTAGSTPIGVLQSYEQIIEVRKAGSVTATGGTTSSLPYITSIPPRIGKVKATVSVELTASSTVTVPVAYNLSNTSCSATTINQKVTPIGVEQGGSLTVAVYNTRQSTSHQPFSNYYATNTGDSGSITTAASIIRDDDNIIGKTLDETSSTEITLTGSSTEPPTTGLYDEQLEPVFIDALGTQYYRRTKYTI